MPTNFLMRSFGCLVATAIVLPLAMGQSGLSPVAHDPARLINAGDPSAPQLLVRGSSELLIGELTCHPDPFDPHSQVTFVAHGTIEVQTGAMGEVISRLIAGPESPCPAIRQAAASAVAGLGCATGDAGNDTLTFVCHEGRERAIQVMATVSTGILTGQF